MSWIIHSRKIIQSYILCVLMGTLVVPPEATFLDQTMPVWEDMAKARAWPIFFFVAGVVSIRAAGDPSCFQGSNRANGACFSTNTSLNCLQALGHPSFLLCSGKTEYRVKWKMHWRAALLLSSPGVSPTWLTPDCPLHKHVCTDFPGHGFNPSGKIPHAAEQLSPCATTTEPAL